MRWVEVPPGTGIMMVCRTKATAVSAPTAGKASTWLGPKCLRAAHTHKGAEMA
jgi:hypothetical protein